MNVDCRRLGTSVGRVRILAAGLVLVAAGCIVLGWGSRSRQNGVQVAGNVPAMNLPTTPTNLPVAGLAPVSKHQVRQQARSLFAGLPLMFEPNVGQGNLDPGDARARFVARGSGYSLFLGSEGALLNLQVAGAKARRERKNSIAALEGLRQPKSPRQATSYNESLGMKLVGANPEARVAAADPLPGKSNYLLGNDPAKWRSGVPQFGQVRYENVYPGINLVFYGNQGRLEYDFQVAPGADPKQAELEFEGAQRLELKDGALVVTGKGVGKSKAGSVRFEAPRIYQEIAGRQRPVEGRFVLRGDNRAGFAIGSYDHARELVIDPVLTFSTYFGGTGNELNSYVAVDQSFNIYLAGSTNSTDLPVTAGAYQPALNPTAGAVNVYIAKITPPLGSNPAFLNFVTYLGGSGMDTPVGVGVDGAGDPYVAGTTSSSNFPVSTTAYQSGPTADSTGPHVFVTRMNSAGSALVYSSYLSGSGDDTASGMTIDAQGNLFVTGSTTSTNPADYASNVEWPVISLPYGQPFQSTPKIGAGGAQFFVTKVYTLGFGPSSIAYSTYFGGGAWNATPQPIVTGGGITVDNSGIIYFTGTTNFVYTGSDSLTDFPILNAYQPCLDQPASNTIINPQSCSNTSTTSASDAFVAKLNPNAPAGTGQLSWATYIGGTGTDSSTGVAVDPGAANVYVVGTTNSTDIAISQNTATTSVSFQRCLDTPPPVAPPLGTACTPPTTTPYPSDAFVARFPNLTPSSTTVADLQLGYFSYLGGSDAEAGLAIVADEASGALITGWTLSPDFYVYGAADIQNSYGGDQDAFIARLNTAGTAQNTAGNWSTYYGGSGVDEGTSITLDLNQNVYFAGDTTSTNATLRMQDPLPGDTNNNGGSDAFVTELGDASTITVTGVLTLASNQTYVSAGNPATFTYTITNSGPDPAYNLSLVDDLANAGVPLAFSTATTTNGSICGGGSTSQIVDCPIPSLQAGSTVTVTIVLTPTIPSGNLTQSGLQFTGGTVQVLSAGNILLAQTSVSAQLSNYSMSISPANRSVVAGDTASFQVQLVPNPVYTNSISLACSGLPAATSCVFTPTSVTLAGATPGTATLSITTTVRPIFTTSNSLTRHFYALWLMVPGLALLGLRSGNRRRRRIAGLLLLCSIFSLLVLLPACSHGVVQPPVSGTPAGTYQINVTGTSGSDAKSQQIVLTVS